MTKLSDERIADLKETTRLIGDRWSLLVVWACLDGATRFEEIRRRLGIARNILSDRLGRLTDMELLVRRPVARGARRMEYVPGEKAQCLRPVIRAMIDWSARSASHQERRKVEWRLEQARREGAGA